MSISRVICAISGGVDSAVAALLLKQKGYDVLGVFMRNWDLRDEKGHCSNDEDYDYATRVCKALDIPFQEVNLVKEYWTNVFVPSMNEYENGNTPNPDVLCNHYVKFDALHKKCQKFVKSGNVVIASGHYAQTSLGERILQKNHNFISSNQRLLKAIDPDKDQTFFLHQITAKALLHTYFPLGNMYKKEIKEIAKNSEVSFTLQRKESMGICFIGKREFPQFIQDYLPAKPGKFICYETGAELGQHGGYFMYTVGQRSKLGGFSDSYAVLHRDPKTGNVFVIKGVNHPALYARSMVTDPLHWVGEMPESLKEGRPLHCQFRFMHRQPLDQCVVHRLDGGRQFLIVLDRSTRALTVGQSAVLYSGNECLGGGRINDVGPSLYECQAGDKINFTTFRENPNFWCKLIDTYGEDVAAFPGSRDDKLHDAAFQGVTQCS